MGKLMIINGSPRAPRSNSKKYGEIFTSYYTGDVDTFNINKSNHKELVCKMESYEKALFVFPLYADSIPVTLLNFLKYVEENPPKNKPNINIIINCGFIECEQNDVCIEMIKLFCKEIGFDFGSVLSIGSGEAILNTPFKFIINWKIKKLAWAIYNDKNEYIRGNMPLTKKMFIKASRSYWINYGKRNGITGKEMETMKIEDK